MFKNKIIGVVLVFFLSNGFPVLASDTQIRLDKDIVANRPIVIQVTVALADKKHQWIGSVPKSIGNGQDADTNLYWGARYGIKTYMTKDAGWEKVASIKPQDKRILERLVLKKNFLRKNRSVSVYLVADAWDGRYICDTIQQFLSYNAGDYAFIVQLEGKKLYSGGKAHLIVYIGHNALMDYFGIRNRMLSNPEPTKDNPDNDAIVLACKSQSYFTSRLIKLASYPLVLTTDRMAPEAYSLHGAIAQWIAGANDIEVRKAAAISYSKYQKIGQKAAKRLFGVKQ